MYWSLPLVVLPVVVLAAFLAWCLSTQPGTRWALSTGAGLAGAQVEQVSGTIWRGVRVGQVQLESPTLGLAMRDLVLRVEWQDLLHRHLWVHELSAGDVAVALRSDGTQTPPDAEGFTMPALPVSLTLTRFAVGRFTLTQDDAPVLGASDVLAALDVQRDGQGTFDLLGGKLSRDSMQVALDGGVQWREAGGDWPLTARLNAVASAADAQAPICISQYLPDLARPASEPQTCALTAQMQAEGSLQSMQVVGQASGQGLTADLDVQLHPRASFPLRSGKAALQLPDGARLLADLDWRAGQEGGLAQVDAHLQMDRLDIQAVGGQGLPQARLTAQVTASAQMPEQGLPRQMALRAQIAPSSSWLGQPLQASLDVQATLSEAPQAQWWTGLRLARLNVQARVADNRVHTEGGLGGAGDRLNLDIDLPQLAQLWPGLPGGATARGWVEGGVARHRAELDASYRLQAQAEPDAIGQAPVQVKLGLQGGWGPLNALSSGMATPTEEAPTRQGWQGQVTALAVQHAGMHVDTQGPVPVTVTPGADGALDWRVGAFPAQVQVPGLQPFVLEHHQSGGGAAGLDSRGEIPRLILTRGALRALQSYLAPDESASRGRVILADNPRLDNVELVFGVDWNLRLADALAGTLAVRRLEGDFIVPAEQPFPLDLSELDLTVQAEPAGAGASRVTATFSGASGMGSARLAGRALLRRQAEGGWALRDTDPLDFDVQADLRELGWISLLAGDALEIGGRLQADVSGRLLPGGQWDTDGTITGEALRIVRIDDGVRLLDGTLRGRFEGSRVILESLRFPARLRVTPKEWRTDEWVRTNPDAQGGYLDISASWDLNDFQGGADIALHRYPVLQRSDRYAMLSGQLRVEVPYPAVVLTGKVDADAGWIDLDMLSSVPTVDSDVVVVRKGDEAAEVATPMDITLDLQIGLGPRFYITGYGVDSGLVGDLRLRMAEGRLTAEGVLRTRGGAISAYGQRLQLRAGSITFQGDIASPTLNIEALRTGQQIQAGVRVAGTARRPRIDLISYPEVSEVEKLSWFLLGRGPDESGSDAALLFSVGSSFLTDGEPFYRRFGLDEVTMRTGELGSAGSVLPPESVVRGFDSGTSDIERQFIVASKRITDGLSASVEQALSDTGTVGRLAYRLGPGLSAQLVAGTVNGVALIYRGFSD